MSNYLNDSTRDLLNDRLNSANDVTLNANQATSNDPEAFTQDPTKSEGGFLRQAQAAEAKPLDIGGGSQNAAIQRRADSKFYDPEAEKSKRMLSSTQRGMNKLGSLKDLAMSQYRLDNVAQSAEMNRISQENAQRNAVVGQVLGLGGMIAGFAIGGPAGGAVGGQAGNMAGQSYNQNENMA